MGSGFRVRGTRHCAIGVGLNPEPRTLTPSPFHSWWLAIRPKTLGAAIAPVLIGCAMAWVDDVGHAWAALAALSGALLLQIAANFANDYFDWKKGADDETRVGPTRVVSAGLVKPAT